MSDRATLDELFEFANKVRAAGGGNPLDALMPAVPEDTSQCLIAKNLNFNCAVNSHPVREDGSVISEVRWHMSVADEATRDKIADDLGLEHYDGGEDVEDEDGNYMTLEYGVVLPKEIGQVAHDFDQVTNVLYDMERGYQIKDEDKALVEDFWPYLDASIKEAYDLATHINEDGSIIL